MGLSLEARFEKYCDTVVSTLMHADREQPRVHAASVTETLGAGFTLLGLMLQAGLTLVCAKLIMIGVLILFMSPTATHALTRAALVRGLDPVLADEGGGSSKHS